jgi:hypothetical protein
MEWKRRCRAFTVNGVTSATVYACEPCGQIVQIAKDGPAGGLPRLMI